MRISSISTYFSAYSTALQEKEWEKEWEKQETKVYFPLSKKGKEGNQILTSENKVIFFFLKTESLKEICQQLWVFKQARKMTTKQHACFQRDLPRQSIKCKMQYWSRCRSWKITNKFMRCDIADVTGNKSPEWI